ncbi:hypothetical protein LPJ78_001400 [Coemansia sp. RSA 989]|nr:hypothetical protein LPJ68_000948 [Coemansia sp. RSA 1086]KAJ1752111.1 hypothetical protein LPJ79_001520 [Coemansia sp. RSA 1821]KAJ1866976.1 hypothetical protein LPJ78_001400 [Coemansia sp. RSA 989]KAJ1874210.1 hypothetical protein LPJ55_001697 [Coemansia sp. RSA 990]KAJ2649747.1 hypothetical protein IWW40_002923 [Coemansia sp. RSA 1250]KAJ2670868.1 hypothetical protein IWW42_003737 [Coemansia sp. RSA 1085]
MDRQNEQRREYLYSNLSKQLTRLNQNFEQLNSNMAKLKDQTEQSQRLAILHTATFMGAKTVFSSQTEH